MPTLSTLCIMGKLDSQRQKMGCMVTNVTIHTWQKCDLMTQNFHIVVVKCKRFLTALYPWCASKIKVYLRFSETNLVLFWIDFICYNGLHFSNFSLIPSNFWYLKKCVEFLHFKETSILKMYLIFIWTNLFKTKQLRSNLGKSLLPIFVVKFLSQITIISLFSIWTSMECLVNSYKLAYRQKFLCNVPTNCSYEFRTNQHFEISVGENIGCFRK